MPFIRVPKIKSKYNLYFKNRNHLVPNHDVSQVVSKAIAEHNDHVDRLIEIIENEFKSINDDIERQIFNACQGLINTLNAQDNSLSDVLEDQNSVNEKLIIIVWDDN